jgi:hypothetical protein
MQRAVYGRDAVVLVGGFCGGNGGHGAWRKGLVCANGTECRSYAGFEASQASWACRLVQLCALSCSPGVDT